MQPLVQRWFPPFQTNIRHFPRSDLRKPSRATKKSVFDFDSHGDSKPEVEVDSTLHGNHLLTQTAYATFKAWFWYNRRRQQRMDENHRRHSAISRRPTALFGPDEWWRRAPRLLHKLCWRLFWSQRRKTFIHSIRSLTFIYISYIYISITSLLRM